MKYYVSDSRSLDFAGPMSRAEALKWLDIKCARHGMEPGDWQREDYWEGCESPPRLFTEAEWLKIKDELG